MDAAKLIRSWYLVVISVLAVLVVVYVVMHLQIPGAEVVRLSKQEITDMNMILFGNNNPSQPAGNDAGRAASDTLTPAGVAARGSAAPPDSVRRGALYNYIFSVRPSYDSTDMKSFRDHFNAYSLEQFAAVVPNYPIRVKSYFWLTEGRRKVDTDGSKKTIEGSIYLEIVFWTLFGLIANLLYRVSESVRTDEFRPEEIGVHIAKFFYAPLCSLVVFFSFNMLVSQGDISVVEFSHATIVLAFILGFFSGRTVELLERIKDLLLPLNRDNKPLPAPVGAGPGVPPPPGGPGPGFASLTVAKQTELAQAAIEKNLSDWKQTHAGLKGAIPWTRMSIINGQARETAQCVVLFQVELPEWEPDHTGQLPKFIEYNGYQIPTGVELTRVPKPQPQPDPAGNTAGKPGNE